MENLKLEQAAELKIVSANVSTDELVNQAIHFYELSCDPNKKTEQCAQFRHKAQQIAEDLLLQPEYRADAANLLCRIALDEGFYDKATDLITLAKQLKPNNAAFEYSAGHIYLAKQQFSSAEKAFRRALDLDDSLIRAATSLAYTKARKGNVAGAFQDYRHLIRRFPDDDHIRAKLFECVALIHADKFDPLLAEDTLTFLNIEGVNYYALAPLITSLIKHKYQLDRPIRSIDLNAISQDELLLTALRKVYFTDPDIEKFIRLIRKQLLLDSLIQININNDFIELANALAIYASLNEYVYYVDDQEKPLIGALEQLIEEATQNNDWRPATVSGAILVYAMYEPIHQLNSAEKIASFELDEWPSFSQAAIKHGLYDVLEEKREAEYIPQLREITNHVSLAVQKQYEVNPYPRWLHLNFNTPTNYGRALEAEFSQFRAPSFFNFGDLQVLIAGCGTGRHALHVAKYFRNVQVLAIDLSRRSLAYAQRMARKYEVDNIEFMQADILDLNLLNRKFHIIECSGVLHHMENPNDGWQILKQLLLPDGLLKVGLYSSSAREIIRRSRAIIDKNDLQPVTNDIRLFRQAVLNESKDKVFRNILQSSDFYNTSGCRDLLFHVNEHQFNLPQIKDLCKQNELEFLGFVLNPETKKGFKEYFGKQHRSADISNLDLWDEFEKDNPEVFGGMYQFFTKV